MSVVVARKRVHDGLEGRVGAPCKEVAGEHPTLHATGHAVEKAQKVAFCRRGDAQALGRQSEILTLGTLRKDVQKEVDITDAEFVTGHVFIWLVGQEMVARSDGATSLLVGTKLGVEDGVVRAPGVYVQETGTPHRVRIGAERKAVFKNIEVLVHRQGVRKDIGLDGRKRKRGVLADAHRHHTPVRVEKVFGVDGPKGLLEFPHGAHAVMLVARPENVLKAVLLLVP